MTDTGSAFKNEYGDSHFKTVNGESRAPPFSSFASRCSIRKRSSITRNAAHSAVFPVSRKSDTKCRAGNGVSLDPLTLESGYK
jgi:hypothetical protein